MNFINRTKELDWLDRFYSQAKSQGQLLILYGKRRVGKTELVKHFGQDKPFAYYVASKDTSQALRLASEAFADALGVEILKNVRFASWRDLLKLVSDQLPQESDQPTVLVVDEFPYLVEADETVSADFQVAWDEFLQHRSLMMIIMGSSISMMYKHALNKKAPLYGRRSGQWLLEPFSYKETIKFWPDANFENRFSLYAITGGIPAYAKLMDGQKNLRENLVPQVFTEGTFMSIEPELLLADEFEDVRTYLRVLKAIGIGKTKFSEIIQASELEATALPRYLKILQELRLVKREIPVTAKMPEKSKTSTYSLTDPFLRLYFSFTLQYQSLIRGGSYDTLFEKYGSTLNNLVAKAYEDTASAFIQEVVKAGKLPHIEQMGRWWQKDAEIDLVGLNEAEDTIIFTEIKWQNALMDVSHLQHLKAQAAKLEWGSNQRKEYYVLVSKSGFTQGLLEQKDDRLVLIKEDELL